MRLLIGVIDVGSILWMIYHYRQILQKLILFITIVWLTWHSLSFFTSFYMYFQLKTVFDSRFNWLLVYPDKLTWPFYIIILFRLKTLSIYTAPGNNSEEKINKQLGTLQCAKILYTVAYFGWFITRTLSASDSKEVRESVHYASLNLVIMVGSILIFNVIHIYLYCMFR